MRWQRASTVVRRTCLVLGLGSLALAAHLTRISASGIEDVPPPFILVAGLAGLVLLGVAVVGRYLRAVS